MSASTTIPSTSRLQRPRRLIISSALAAVIAVAAWGIPSYTGGSASRPAHHGTPTQASVLSALTPSERQYVLGINSLTPTQLRAAFGTDQPSNDKSWMRLLPASERRYARAVASMSYPQLAAAYADDAGSVARSERSLTQSQQAQPESSRSSSGAHRVAGST